MHISCLFKTTHNDSWNPPTPADTIEICFRWFACIDQRDSLYLLGWKLNRNTEGKFFHLSQQSQLSAENKFYTVPLACIQLSARKLKVNFSRLSWDLSVNNNCLAYQTRPLLKSEIWQNILLTCFRTMLRNKMQSKLLLPESIKSNWHRNWLFRVKYRGTQREYSSKPLEHSVVNRILVFKRYI